MKHLLLAILLIAITSCQAQKKPPIYYPKVDNQFEKFNFEEYKDEYEIRESIYNIGQGKKENRAKYELIKKINDSIIIIEFIKTEEGIKNLYKEVYFKGSPLFFFRQYHSNGNIQKKGISLVSGKGVGIWYEFNENGNRFQQYRRAGDTLFQGWQQGVRSQDVQ